MNFETRETHQEKTLGSLTYIQVTWLLWLCHEIVDKNKRDIVIHQEAPFLDHTFQSHSPCIPKPKDLRVPFFEEFSEVLWGCILVIQSFLQNFLTALYPLSPWAYFQEDFWTLGCLHCFHSSSEAHSIAHMIHPIVNLQCLGRWRLTWTFAFSSLKGLKLWFWFKKSDGFLKQTPKNQWKPRPNVGFHKFTGPEHSFFQETPFPRMDEKILSRGTALAKSWDVASRPNKVE